MTGFKPLSEHHHDPCTDSATEVTKLHQSGKTFVNTVIAQMKPKRSRHTEHK